MSFTQLPKLRHSLLSHAAFLLLFCLPTGAQAQRNVPYYSATADAARQKLAAETAASVRAKFREPERFDKKSKEAYAAARERIATDVSDEIGQSALPDDALWPFLKKTHAAIVAANPECAATKVILAANPTPNAYSVGEGTIVVYSGLLAGLENEDQLAFVLCHEIAHFLLEHATDGLAREISTFHSKAFKEKVKAANAQEFNRNEQLEKIYKNALFKSRYHRRDLELQADSLAYHLYLKTSYAPNQARRLIQLFENIDEPLRDSVLQLENHFGCAQYPFQAGWLGKKKGSVWADAKAVHNAAEKPVRDSLRTHPDWQNRLQWIEETAQKIPAGASQSAPSEETYAPVRYLAILESVDAWFFAGRYDRALYYAAQYRDVYPECIYFKELEALAINGLYTNSKAHTLADVLSQRSDDYPEQYNRFLDFLNALRLKDLLGLQRCSMEALGAAEKTEYGLMAAYSLALAEEDRETMRAIKKEYLSKHRKGRFSEIFQETKK